ncbi:MAG: hypothetical protein JST68_03710 [Bacteroidetes bacterium]|nr:hypothetical protein [Bacteroidota bacterium]
MEKYFRREVKEVAWPEVGGRKAGSGGRLEGEGMRWGEEGMSWDEKVGGGRRGTGRKMGGMKGGNGLAGKGVDGSFFVHLLPCQFDLLGRVAPYLTANIEETT